jgi:phosphatidate cytidylyltransferase
MLSQRLIFGTLMIAALLGLVFADGWVSERAVSDLRTATQPATTLPAWTAAAILTGLAVLTVVLATREMGLLVGVGGYRPMTGWAAFVGVGLMLLPWLEMQQRLAPVSRPVLPLDLPHSLLWLMGAMWGIALLAFARKRTERATGDMAVTLWMMMYLGLLGSFILRIRCMESGAAGAALFLYFVLTVKSSDIGAYFTGSAIGKNKLAPWLSPGKSVEGAAGAVVFAALVAWAGLWFWRQFEVLGSPPLAPTAALVFGGVMAICGHVGDLVESLMKRDVGSKDSGAALPAFGGLLDVLDSLLYTAPIGWILLTLLRQRG